MHMLYNSDQFVVVQFDLSSDELRSSAGKPVDAPDSPRGGYEIVDKFARKEIFIEGEMAHSFMAGVEALIQTSPSEDEMDAYMGRYVSLMQQPVVLH